MARGHEAKLSRDNQHNYMRRKLGLVDVQNATTGHLQGMTDLQQSLHQMQPAFFVGPNGNVYTPQHADGSFDYLPGYDGPV